MNTNPIMNDEIFTAMTTVLAIHRHSSVFPDLLRSFWTTLCVLNGIDPIVDAEKYEDALDTLCTVYAREGIKIDRDYLREYLDSIDDEDDDDDDGGD